MVVTKYNNKTYRITRVAFDLSPKSTFFLKEGSEISFADYFLKKYNEEVKDLN